MLNSISGMRIIILVLLLATNQHYASETTSLTSLAKFEQCQANNLGHVFLVGKDVSLRKCAAHCSKKEWCKGLAFGRSVMLCSLYNTMAAWGKTQSTQGDCAVIYRGNLTGMDFADVKLEDLKECDEFVTVANGTVLGNMNREGNRKQVVCNKGFIIKNGSDISQCKNGTWTPKPTCVPECENSWRKHGSACYLLVETNGSANKSNNICAAAGAKLLTIPTTDDMDFISTPGIAGTHIWTGLRLNGNVWQDMYTNENVSKAINCYYGCVYILWSSAPNYLSCSFCSTGYKYTACKKPFGI